MNEFNPIYGGGTNISYTTNASRQYPTHRVTRTIAQPIVVSREDLIKNLAGATDAYKKAMLDTRDVGTAVGSAVDDKMVEKMLSTPQNKGRLESELPIESALMCGLLKGFQAYNTVSNMKLAQEKENYLNFLKQVEMEDAMRAREEAAAAKNAELNKTTIEDTQYTEPVGGGQAQYGIYKSNNGQTVVASPLTNFRADLENIGTRFDSSFKNIDEMQKGSTRFGRWNYNNLWGIGVSDTEKQARDDFEAWKGSMRNVLVNANRQAGTGSMSDMDAARFEQKIGEAKTPAEARNILDSFEAKMLSAPVQELRNAYSESQPNNMTPIDIANKYGATVINQ